jgi:hypothetical protein
MIDRLAEALGIASRPTYFPDGQGIYDAMDWTKTVMPVLHP